jgi:hypothetical protein
MSIFANLGVIKRPFGLFESTVESAVKNLCNQSFSRPSKVSLRRSAEGRGRIRR